VSRDGRCIPKPKALTTARTNSSRTWCQTARRPPPRPTPRPSPTAPAGLTGQDLEEGPGGVFRIARRVAPDRVISTVDPQARHGHKTSARGFDGYKGHVAVDPESR
jgi:hypothetical protein